jgi:hypothetical protein
MLVEMAHGRQGVQSDNKCAGIGNELEQLRETVSQGLLKEYEPKIQKKKRNNHLTI